MIVHPVEAMLLGNLNATRHHNQWCHWDYQPKVKIYYNIKPTCVSALLCDPCRFHPWCKFWQNYKLAQWGIHVICCLRKKSDGK